jgi:hypothetical protein
MTREEIEQKMDELAREPRNPCSKNWITDRIVLRAWPLAAKMYVVFLTFLVVSVGFSQRKATAKFRKMKSFNSGILFAAPRVALPSSGQVILES